MPTTIDQFFAIVQICQNLSTMQNNMRANVQTIKTSHDAPGAVLSTVAGPGYVAGSGQLIVADGASAAFGQAVIGLNNSAHTVLRVTAKNGNTLTVTAKQNDQNASVGTQVRTVSNLFEDFPATQQAMRDLGTAFQQRLAMNQSIYDNYPTEVTNGALGVGIVPAEVSSVQSLLVTWATNLSTAIITTQTQLDNGVAAVLANVPPAMLPF
jgi:hypothetical protein